MKFSDFLRQKFGGKTMKIAVDAGFACPHADANRGCAWCDNASFSAADTDNFGAPLSATSIREQVQRQISRVKKKHPQISRFIVYFQPRTNTNAPVEKLNELYAAALTENEVVGIAIGTRPDCVDPKKIALLAKIARRKFVQIEYGLQSINDTTLRALNRGHSVADFQRAIAITRGRGISICAHLIVGLPGDALDDAVRAAKLLAEEKIDGVKIHNLHIVKNTALAERFATAPFPLMTLEDYAVTVAKMLRELPPEILEQRLVAAPRNSAQLVAPAWCLNCAEVLRRIEFWRENFLRQKTD